MQRRNGHRALQNESRGMRVKVQKSKCAVFILASVQVCKVHRCKVHGGVFFFFLFSTLFVFFFLFWLVGFLPLVRAVETRLFLYWLASRCANGAFFGWVASTSLTQSRPSQLNCYGPQGTWEKNSTFKHHGPKQNCTKACSWDNH